MKLRFLLVLLVLCSLRGPLAAVTREAAWAEVEEAVQNRLPRTALERLEPIVTAALAEEAYPEAVKAIGYRIVLEASLEEVGVETRIERMETELASAPPPMRPVMQAILGHWYWRYFQDNRWRILQRTQTAAPSGPDLRTWDLARLLREIDARFTAALAEPAALQAIPIADYAALLEPGTAPDEYRPTLFDFLAHEALSFYQAGEQGAVVAEDEFVVAADSPIFGSVEDFLAWELPEGLASAPVVKAIHLYQALLEFHAGDADRAAQLDTDLARLTWGKNVGTGDAVNERYRAALEGFISRAGSHDIAARGLAALAAQWESEGEPARARDVARQGVAQFPGTHGAVLCFNLIQQVEAPAADLTTERVWNAPWPKLQVTYRNVDRVYFRAVPLAFREYVTRTRWGYGQVDAELLQTLLSNPPVLEWAEDLPPTTDLKPRTESLPAPTSLTAGLYVVVASHDATFAHTGNQLSVSCIWVSNLALVTRDAASGNSAEGLVLAADSGEPLAGAQVRLWQRQDDGIMRPGETTRTDARGEFRLRTRQNRSYLLEVEHEGEQLASVNESWPTSAGRREREQVQTMFFTDRALYRPGQTISYKGIVFRADRAAADYETLSRERVVVALRDANGQEVAQAEHRTNDYGSFSGVFTAPRTGLTGRMSIEVVAGPAGSVGLSVEEYKRPKFEVTLETPEAAPRLEESVILTGRARSYTGVDLGGARVKWRVERTVDLPRWCWWWPSVPAKAVAQGTATTADDGTFTVEFAAAPDPTVPEANEPVFRFHVYSDVTDSTGETRSAERTIPVGYRSLRAAVSAGEWQTADAPVVFDVSAASLDGAPRAASGRLRVHALLGPDQVQRAELDGSGYRWPQPVAGRPVPPPDGVEAWELGEVVTEEAVEVAADGTARVAVTLPAGAYRAMLELTDAAGRPVAARHNVVVVAPEAEDFLLQLAQHLAAPDWTVEPGEVFRASWATGYDSGRAYVEVESDGRMLQRYWTEPGRTQAAIEVPVEERHRGGITLRITFVRENRAYLTERTIAVPWTNRELTLAWETFRSKLTPGGQETWTAVIRGPEAEGVAAEMAAVLYDASLDQFLPHHWNDRFSGFRREFSRGQGQFHNSRTFLAPVHSWPAPEYRSSEWQYRSFPERLVRPEWHEVLAVRAYAVATSRAGGYRASAEAAAPVMELADAGESGNAEMKDAFDLASLQPAAPGAEAVPGEPVDLDQVAARRNLQETAFFFPHLLSDEDGNVRMTFTIPEALTRWRFLGFAHDARLRSGGLTATAVTSKDLMVEPNPPRFVREGDVVEFTVKVSNQSEAPQSGRVRLSFATAAGNEAQDARLGNTAPEQAFELPAKQARTFSWRIAVPDGMGFLAYRAVAATGALSDGEEGYLPVLSRRILVTESLPLPIRGPGTSTFRFPKLLAAADSDTLRHQALTIEMTSQPAWYAVMALPFLMEFPYECSEQVFNRYYANRLAGHLANGNPRIRRVFNQWKNTAALDSPLEKNEAVKAVVLEETPWVRLAQSESAARRHVGLLFDANRLGDETDRALRTLTERQGEDGLWAWFPGGRPSEYISLYIATGFGRLRHLGATADVAPAVRAWAGVDGWMVRQVDELRRESNADEHVPTALEALYLYGRSFFREDRPLEPKERAAVDYLLAQARQHWSKVPSRQTEAHLALALHRFGDAETAGAILRSLKERSRVDGELGRSWPQERPSWWWYEAPIETQALMIEAFDEVANDRTVVEECQVWLLKQKQTQDWGTTKATADAVYSLLLRGDDWLASDALVEVTVGDRRLEPEQVEAGTGYFQERIAGAEVQPAMGEITLRKTDAGVSWGSVHWQYLEEIGKITSHTGTPLQIQKTLWIRANTERGRVLQPVTGPLSVGDELVVRLELRTDRDMEYVHLKDQRGSGTEPVNVLSGHRFQDGLGYYESTRDTASHFFIEHLPRGVYVFEYAVRVQLKGEYESGLAEVQCMYAPEFNSHSESIRLEVR